MAEAKTELITHLTKELTEELAGVASYLDWAELARQADDHYLERGLCEIAKDEYTHAKFIRDYLIDSGVTVTADQEMKWTIVKDRIAHKFHRR